METRAIYEMEEANRTGVILHKEGIFWRAYQHSAYFVTRELKKCAVLRKYVKKIQADLVYVGFPDTGLKDFLTQAVERGVVVKERGEKLIVLDGFDGLDEYETWMGSVAPAVAVSAPSKTLTEQKNCDECPYHEISRWQLAGLTPMEVMVKLSELQGRKKG